ncbi:hypothetical protein CBNA_1159 [Coxiella burnetii str. Namibia]|nr:hypothetical protein CBNA_1159 [Coxiella burnetii str. Namibia]
MPIQIKRENKVIARCIEAPFYLKSRDYIASVFECHPIRDF